MATKDEKKDAVNEKETIANADVLTKYKIAGEMANRIAKLVADACKPEASILSICKLGDEAILKETSAVYNKKVDGKLVEKGIAFPTCISVNNCICHNSPLESEEQVLLKNGDVVKIDLGVHIDGYIAPVATTIVVGATKETPVDGDVANVVLAAYQAAEVVARLCQIGRKASEVTDAINKVAADFGCTAVEGMMSHSLARNVIDGEKHIVQAPTAELKKENKDFEFKENDIFALDVLISSGDGKPKKGEQRTTVFKKTETHYLLKQKAARSLLQEISAKFTVMPFSLRACESESQARLGLVECLAHKVVEPFDILWEKPGTFVAQFKILVMVTVNGCMRVTGGLLDTATLKTDKKLSDAELLKALATVSISGKKKKAPAAAKTTTEPPPA